MTALYSSAANPSQPATLETKLGYGDYIRFRDLVLKESGLHFPESKRLDLELGLLKAMASSPVAEVEPHQKLEAYYRLLLDETDSARVTEMRRLINALTVGETHFFRDEYQFDALIEQVLPQLIERKQVMARSLGPEVKPRLRIWSAGCASGEEPYSIAIALKQLLPEIHNWQILILATDINENLLAKARWASYSDWSFREARAKQLRDRYFYLEPDSLRYRLSEDLQKMVTFARLNLVTDDYPLLQNNTFGMDLILCRNVTIYFTEVVTRQVIKRFHSALVEGGWLVVGHAEPSLVVYQAFQAHSFPGTLLYQKMVKTASGPEKTAWVLEGTQTPIPNLLSVTGSERPDQPLADWVPVVPEIDQVGTPPPAINGSSARAETAADPYGLAMQLLDGGLIEEAITELNRKLAESPDFAAAHAALGRAYADLGRWNEARRWCQSALALDSLQAEAYCVLGMVYQYEGLNGTAIDMLKKAIYLDREQPVAHFSLGMLYKKLGQTGNARRSLRNTVRVLEKWPPDRLIPNSDGATAKYLLDAALRVLNRL
ncbi:MAG TPA: CheR family methyltransferase [Anaerolineae bacterium]|nr:CheR family methyltransferase [Anaerolineae bacterium]HMR65017.1 CheR family methyltransferase [Anaerolineae bacterium]